MTYSIITLGGTAIESGITKEEAETFVAEKGSYYSVVADEAAEEIAAAPTFEELLGAMEKPDSTNAGANEEINEKVAVETGGGFWSEVINEGGEGYQSNNW